MSAPVVRVPRHDAERARRQLASAGALADDRRIAEEDGWVYLPLRPDRVPSTVPGEVVERHLEPVGRSPPRDYRELLEEWSAEERSRLPRSYDVVGEIVLVRLPPALAPRGREIGEALRRFVPRARLVGADYGVHGAERRREVERLAGSGPWRTRHRENGIEFDVDVERAYFSPRLAREHARVAAEVRGGERIYDLCCGVGPFALTIARASPASAITAVDSNPDAIALLRATRARYPWARAVEPVGAPVERFFEGAAAADRAILNLPREGIKYIGRVAELVISGGAFHYYEVVGREKVDARATELRDRLGPPGRWTLREHHLVHPYSPAADLIGFTFVREGA